MSNLKGRYINNLYLHVFYVCLYIMYAFSGVPTFKHATLKHATLKHGHLNTGQINPPGSSSTCIG